VSWRPSRLLTLTVLSLYRVRRTHLRYHRVRRMHDTYVLISRVRQPRVLNVPSRPPNAPSSFFRVTLYVSLSVLPLVEVYVTYGYLQQVGSRMFLLRCRSRVLPLVSAPFYIWFLSISSYWLFPFYILCSTSSLTALERYPPPSPITVQFSIPFLTLKFVLFCTTRSCSIRSLGVNRGCLPAKT
jgi:hypothetical protein